MGEAYEQGRNPRPHGNAHQQSCSIDQHGDLDVMALGYRSETDTLYLEIAPRSAARWADTAYEFARHQGMSYDMDAGIYGFDGQPRVSYGGQVWVRYISGFLDGSLVAVHIWSRQSTHRKAKEQLCRFYSLFQERDKLKPVEVFRKFVMPDD